MDIDTNKTNSRKSSKISPPYNPPLNKKSPQKRNNKITNFFTISPQKDPLFSIAQNASRDSSGISLSSSNSSLASDISINSEVSSHNPNKQTQRFNLEILF